MYRTNEKAFEEDVERFMSSHGLTLSSPPIWHNVKVNIFSIFLAVYERGGYERVCYYIFVLYWFKMCMDDLVIVRMMPYFKKQKRKIKVIGYL